MYNFRDKKCRYCGNTFKPIAGNQVTCKSKECERKRFEDYRLGRSKVWKKIKTKKQEEKPNVLMPKLSEMSSDDLLHYGRIQTQHYTWKRRA